MTRCRRCLIPDTRPGMIFKDGVCQACLNYEKRQKMNWASRRRSLGRLCAAYKDDRDKYDCLVPVSGGKDSHVVTATMLEQGMHPLLFCLTDPFTHTEAGEHNLNNISRVFGCDLYCYTMSIDLALRAIRDAFESRCEPLMLLESAIYTLPVKIADMHGVHMVMFGENSAFLYGTSKEDAPHVVSPLVTGDSSAGDAAELRLVDHWLSRGFDRRDLDMLTNIPRSQVDSYYMSHFIPWDDEDHAAVAKAYGFHDITHEWMREGCVEDYTQIDSYGYMVHIWLKYPKFGFARATDIVSRWIRKGTITREEGLRLVMENDHKLDQLALEDFCKVLGYTEHQFWNIVEPFWNRDLFHKVNGVWRFKDAD